MGDVVLKRGKVVREMVEVGSWGEIVSK